MDATGPTPEAMKTLTRIGLMADQRDLIEDSLTAQIGFARSQGASWRMIGVALGTSTQSAWERYRPRTPGRSPEGTAYDAPLPLELEEQFQKDPQTP